MNRAQRRELARRLHARGIDLIVLHGGPMDGWSVKHDAPVLAPDWRDLYLEASAEGLYLAARQPSDHTPWSRLSDAARTPYRVEAQAIHGAGHYVLRSSEAIAVWQEAA